MNTVPITVAIPVGPSEANKRWLDECIGSVLEQSVMPDEILVIDDGAKLNWEHYHDEQHVGLIRVHTVSWRSGVAHAFNYGVALARNNLVIMLGSDDKLFPDAVKYAYNAWQERQDKHGYYYFAVEYSDGRKQYLPCHGAMVTKDLWNLTGGLLPESAVGASDTILISRMMAANGKLGNLYGISKECLYWHRVHGGQDTMLRAKWQGVIFNVREILTNEAAAL